MTAYFPPSSLILLLFLVSFLFPLPARGKKEESPAIMELPADGADSPSVKTEPTDQAPLELLNDGTPITITGKVRRVGNEPFTQLVITDIDGQEWHLDEKGRALLQNFEQRSVTVTASVRLRRMVLADGREMESMKILFDLTLIE